MRPRTSIYRSRFQENHEKRTITLLFLINGRTYTLTHSFIHSFIHSLIHQAAILINATHVGDPFNKEGGGYAAKGCEMVRYSAHNQGR